MVLMRHDTERHRSSRVMGIMENGFYFAVSPWVSKLVSGSVFPGEVVWPPAVVVRFCFCPCLFLLHVSFRGSCIFRACACGVCHEPLLMMGSLL